MSDAKTSVKRFRKRHILASLVVVISLVLATFYMLISTTDGSRWLLRQASSVAPFTVSGIEGSLTTGLRAAHFSLHNEAVEVDIDNLDINIDLWPLLFQQQLRIAQLGMSRLVIKTQPTDNSTETSNPLPSLPALPVQAVLRKLNISDIQVGHDPELATPMALSANRLSLIDQTLEWRDIKFAQGDVKVNSNGKWLASRFEQRLNTKTGWSYQGLSGSLIGEGPLKNWQLNHSLSLGEDLGNAQVFSDGSVAITSLDDIKIAIDNQLSQFVLQGWQVDSSALRFSTDLKDFSLSGDITVQQQPSSSTTGDTPPISLSSRLNATGQLDSGATLELAIKALSGSANINSQLQWRDGLQANTQLISRNLRLDKLPSWPLPLQALANIEADIALQQGDSLAWQLANAKVSGMLGDAPLSLSATAQGSGNNITLQTLQARHLGNSLRANGSLEGNTAKLAFNAVIEDLALYDANLAGDARVVGTIGTSLDNWQKQSRINVSVSSRELSHGDATIGGLSLQLRNVGEYLDGQVKSDFVHAGELALEGFEHTLQGRLSANNVSLSGEASGQAIIAGRRFDLPLTASQVFWYREGDKLLDVAVQANDERFDADFNATLSRVQQLNATLAVNVLSLQWLQDFDPRLQTIEGSAAINSSVVGVLGADEPLQMESRFNVAAPLINIIDPDIKLNDSTIAGELFTDGRFEFSGEARQGEQPITLRGSGRLMGDNTPSLNVTLQAQRLRATTPKIELAVSPDLAVQLDPAQLQVRGSIDIPLAEIELSQLPNPSFSRSDDVVVVGRKQPVVESSRQQDIAVKLRLSDKVIVKAAGLATKLQGELQYTSQHGKPVQLQGKLDLVDGSLSSQSGDLAIKRGSLLFTGSPDNPSVNIIAVRQIDSPAMEVGLHITGTVKDLRTAIISIPAIDQTRALSFLVFGRDITQDDQGGSNSNAQLMSAAISLGIGQSSSLMQNLKRTTGLDELAAVANDSGSASLIAGKQINSKLYARYRYDMAEALGVLLLRYRLSQRWTLEAESGADNSIDVMYRLGD